MIKNKIIVITGGSSGIGKQLAKDYLSTGNRVVIVGLNDIKLKQSVAELSTISNRISGIACDVTDTQAVFQMAKKIIKKYGCPDILINNAGYANYYTFEQSDITEIERLVSVNFLGAVRCTKAFLPTMIKNAKGTHIVNMASIAGKLVMTPNGMYSASKHALVAWSEVLKYELSRFNINIHVICPGRIETAFFDHESFQHRAPRAETKLTIKVEDVSRVTTTAIEQNKFLTYIPWTYGMLVWIMNVFPFIIKPIYGILMNSRIDTIYKKEKINNVK